MLTREPGVMLTDEGHHMRASFGSGYVHQSAGAVPDQQPGRMRSGSQPVGVEPTFAVMRAGGTLAAAMPGGGTVAIARPRAIGFFTTHRRALWLGTLYALGHGTVVSVLGLLAIVASEFLPSWIDPVMERVVGVTLIFLAAYLFVSLYRFFRGGGEFRLRSRWMLIFASIRNAYHWLIARIQGRLEHEHVEAADQYGARTAYGIGMIHGVGAETGTQVLVIATALGAGSKSMGVVTLFAFVIGLLISNSVVTVLSTAGFVSARRRQTIYVTAGLLAATFSLVLGIVFLFQAGGILPNLDPYFRWIGGPVA